MHNVAKIIIVSLVLSFQSSWGMKIKKSFTTQDKKIDRQTEQTINRLTRTRANLETISALRDDPSKVSETHKETLQKQFPEYTADIDKITQETDSTKKAQALEELQTKLQAKELQDRQTLENQIGKNAVDRLTKSQDRLTMGEKVAAFKEMPDNIKSPKKKKEFESLQKEFTNASDPNKQAEAAQKLGKFIESLPKKDQDAIKKAASDEFSKNPQFKSLTDDQQSAALKLFTKAINSKDFKNSYAYRQKEWLTLGFVPAVILSLIMAVVGVYISGALSKSEDKPEEAPAPATDTAPAPSPAATTTSEKSTAPGKPTDSTGMCTFLLKAVDTLREKNAIPAELQTYLTRKIKQQQLLDGVYNQLYEMATEEAKTASWTKKDQDTCERLMAKITGR